MNRHRDDLALVMDSADFRRDSHVRARPPGLADPENVIVRPTIVLQDRRYERRIEAAAGALALQAAKLHALLAEPLTRPLGSMQAPHCFTGEDGITLIQSKKIGIPCEPVPPLAREPFSRDLDRRRADARLAGEPVRYDSEHARFAGAQRAPEPDADTYHGLRELRENAHARLASMEAAAMSGRSAAQRDSADSRRRASELGTAARQPELGSSADFIDRDAEERTAPARPHHGAHRTSNLRQRTTRGQAQHETATPLPGATASVQHEAQHRVATSRMSAPQRRSGGHTDARNALRSAYAASKLRLPNAPPRSSAKNAGIVDGWERLPDRKAKRSRSRSTRPRAVWPWAAGLALSSMLFAYALTLTLTLEPPRTQAVAFAAVPPQPEPPFPAAPQHPRVATAVRAIVPPQPELGDPPLPVSPQHPHAVIGTKTPKPPARPSAHADCRDRAPRSY